MAAGLGALRNDGIDAALFQPDCFLHRRGGRDDEAAGRLDALEQRRLRQAEMEADDLRLQLLDDLAEGGVERRAVRGVDGRCGIEAVLG